MGHLLGYARVSTTEQDPALQHDALAAAGCSACSPTPPPAPRPTGRGLLRCSTSCVPETPSWCRDAVTEILKIAREPLTDDELWWLIKAFWGVELPRHRLRWARQSLRGGGARLLRPGSGLRRLVRLGACQNLCVRA